MRADPNIATLTRFGDAPYFVFCDHASNAMPPELNCLGLPEDMLLTHIAWDIGSQAVGAAVAKILCATFFQCEFSRLIIDPNRSLTAPDLIPETSDQIPIAGNQDIDEGERCKRIDRFHIPYHDQLNHALDEITTRHPAPFIISVHSFTHRLIGAAQDRPWRIGFLWREDEPSARVMIDHLKDKTSWKIGDNEPYDAREFNYSVDRHIGPRKLSHITVEVRQDIISDERGIEEVADQLARAVMALRGDEGP